MRFLPDGVRFAGKSTNLIELLGNGVLSNLAELGVENGKVPVGNDAGQYELKPTSGFGIQDPNGTLAKFAALTTEANKVFATNGTSYPILATIAAILGYTPADRACGTFTGNVTIAPTGGNGQVRVSIGGTNYNWFNQSQIALRNNTTGVYSYLNGNQVWLLRNGGMQIDLGDFSMTQGLINSIFNGNGTRIR
ncbi:hypothetical protein HED51_15245 [Ochrobactrum grignonense]|nr:hypothetical protein [Brucella grignonensis]